MRNILRTRNLVLVTMLVIVSVCAWGYFSYSYIEVVPSGQSTSEIQYTLTKSSDNKQIIISQNPAQKYKKLVRRGSYEILVRQNNKSFISILSASGQLKTTEVSAALQDEKSRTFVGNNPNDCMYLIGGILASYPCNDNIDSLEFHMPATLKQPTYTKKAAGPAATIEAFLPGTSTSQAIIQTQGDGDESNYYHAVYSVNSIGVFDTSGIRELNDLKGDLQYTYSNYKDGYLAVGIDGSDAKYYPDFNKTPTTIASTSPNNKKLPFALSRSRGNNIIMVYSNVGKENLPDLTNPGGDLSHSELAESNSTKKPLSEIVINNGATPIHIVVKQAVVDVVVCDVDKLCVLLGNSQMEVYSLTGDGNKMIFSVGGVKSIHKSISSLYIAKHEGVFEFNIQKREGYMIYVFGNSSYCGANDQEASYVICVFDGNKERALLLNQESANDNIDKKIVELEKSSVIKSLSIYKNIIYITPELGELEYQTSINGYGYNPATKKSTAVEIDSEIKRIGIDTSKYMIINPYR